MTQQLETIMSTLHSDKARLSFLKSIYEPGNTEVVDRILLMSEDSSIIQQEIIHAKEAGNNTRFRKMAERCIDYHVRHDLDILLRGIVIGWQDPRLADYAIEQMTSESEADRKLEGPLEYAAEIAQSFGKHEVAKQHLERLLSLQERDSEYKYQAAQTLKKLGRFDEAIDKYLEDKWVDTAFNLAKEHSPTRVTEIAEIGFRSYKVGSGSAEFYVECAEVLDKTKKAEKTLVKYARRVKIDHPPRLFRIYEGVVKSLVKLRQDKEARDLVTRVARHEEEVKNSGRYYGFDRSEELAMLYHVIGETEAVKNIYDERIDTKIRERHSLSNTLNDIKKAIELTGDTSFREKELEIYEKQKEYKKAANLAIELGRPELAQIYNTMHEMVQTVQDAKGK